MNTCLPCGKDLPANEGASEASVRRLRPEVVGTDAREAGAREYLAAVWNVYREGCSQVWGYLVMKNVVMVLTLFLA